MVDHERIWLQHPDDVDPSVGRLWCEDKVWPDHEDDKEPIEYVRADLYSTLSARVAQLEEALGTIEQQEVHDIALDPEWPRRIAEKALSKKEARG